MTLARPACHLCGLLGPACSVALLCLVHGQPALPVEGLQALGHSAAEGGGAGPSHPSASCYRPLRAPVQETGGPKGGARATLRTQAALSTVSRPPKTVGGPQNLSPPPSGSWSLGGPPRPPPGPPLDLMHRVPAGPSEPRQARPSAGGCPPCS